MARERGPYPVWHPEEDARILEICAKGRPVGDAGWRKVAEEFNARSPDALRQRFLTLRNRKAGITQKVLYRRKRTDIEAQRRLKMQEPVMPASLPQHSTITGYVFGDPLPGRSALDRRNAGVTT